jgi:RHS repeat-associated protein
LDWVINPADKQAIHHLSARFTSVNRYYDPSTAQFLGIDPKLAETGQPYAYTADDPLNQTDPLGLGASPSKADLQWNAKYGCGIGRKRKCRSLGGSLVKALDKVRHAGAAAANAVKHHPVAAATIVVGTALLAVPGAEPAGAELDAAAAPELGVSLGGSGAGLSTVRAFAGLGLIEAGAQSCRSGSAGGCFSSSVGVLALASPGLEPVALSIDIANAFLEAK